MIPGAVLRIGADEMTDGSVGLEHVGQGASGKNGGVTFPEGIGEIVCAKTVEIEEVKVTASITVLSKKKKTDTLFFIINLMLRLPTILE